MRVLRRNDKKRRRQGACFAFHRYLLFLHRLEQRALGFGAGPVDLVGQQHLGENRPAVEYKGLLATFVDRDAGQVARHQVGGELHARKLQAKGARQSMGQRRFSYARHVLNQQVPAGQQAGHAILNLGRLANNHRVKLIQQRFELLLCMHGMTLPEN